MAHYDDFLHMMELQGGSFARSLANCWYCADDTNRTKLESAFKDVFDGYRSRYDAWYQSVVTPPSTT